MAILTRLGAHGGPRSPYGSFAGKASAPRIIDTITRLGAHGGPRQLYGPFTGKAEAGIIIAKTQFGKKFYEKHPEKKRLSAQVLSLRHDEEDLLIILEIIKRLL